jgi:putative ATP-dependent endonuclease of the OLD family
LGKLLGHDFDELGITVCSVAGTNFAPYVKLLGSNGLDIPFAVLTDFDPQDGGTNLGERRVTKLLEHLSSARERNGKSDAQLLALARLRGVFLNEYTFEIDLFKCGREKSMAKTLAELTDSQVAKERAEGWRDHPETLNAKAFLKDIEAIGKGRFAQRLAGHLKNNSCPAYIKEAIEYVVSRCR